ncbi:MAG: succinate semialdehyde dehydrogenase NADP+ linked [Vezdaea acicularis]|nr:MAG: succinate semialdehyde dehydrogenase NADP+ linked [Vezdaea acicularis]
MASHNAPELKDKSLLIHKCYVDGEWVSARSGKTFEVTDPASGKVIGSCPEFDKADTEAAIAAASTAWPSFRILTGRERATMLRKWYDLMTENAEDLAKLITWENGKPIGDARGEVSYAANFFQWFAEEAPRTYGDTIPASIAGNRVITLKESVGVCGLITPFVLPCRLSLTSVVLTEAT